MKFEGRGKNGNVLMGGHYRPVRCFNPKTGEAIKTFNSLNQAGIWLVKNGMAKSVNSARVNITHALNYRQHYYGMDHWCSDVKYGMRWANA